MRSLVTAGLALAVLVSPLVAQQPDTTRRDTTAIELQAIEVISSIAPTAGPTIGSGVPGRVASVSAEQIDAWEPRLLTDALVTQPGVSLYDDLGTPYKLNLMTRGFNVGPVVGVPPGVSVFLDGIRQNEPDAHEVNFDLLPMEHVKRVELLSGTGSLLGPNSLGGAINLVTRRGTGPLAGELEASGGSFGAWSGEGALGQRLRNGWDYYAAGGYERENGWREATRAENYNGFLNLGHLGTTRGITFQGIAAHSRASTAGSLPQSLYRIDPRRNFTIGDFEDLNLWQGAASGYLPLGGGRGHGTFYYRKSSAERFNVNQAPDDNVRSFTDNYTAGGTADWRRSFLTDRGAFSIRIGSDVAVNQSHIRLFEENPLDPADRSLTTNVKSPSVDAAGYVLADYGVGRVTFSGGARYDYIRVPFRNLLDPGTDTTSTFKRLSPRGGVSVQTGTRGSLYVSAGQSFRAPAILELACADETAPCPLPFALGDDPPLDPVVATTLEVGGQWAFGSTSLTASAYRTSVKDDIAFIQSEQATFQGFFTNIGNTRREGIEVGTQVVVNPEVSLYANYAYTRATYRTAAEIFSIRSDADFAGSPLAGPNQVTPGDRIPLVPAHQLKAGGLVSLGDLVELGLDARYTGSQWFRGDEANETTPLAGYFTANARVGLTVAGWEVNAIVSNVFDSKRPIFGTFNENRQTGRLEAFLTPMTARSFKLVLGRSFGG